MENTKWREIRATISETLNIPEIVVDYKSVSTILLKCVSGISNSKISYMEDISLEDLECTLLTYLGVKGWSFDLDLNPWSIYKNAHGNKVNYFTKIQQLTNLLNYDTIELSYRLCSIYDGIQERINFYDK